MVVSLTSRRVERVLLFEKASQIFHKSPIFKARAEEVQAASQKRPRDFGGTVQKTGVPYFP